MKIFIRTFLTAQEQVWPMPLCYPRKDLLFKHVVLSCLAQMSNEVKQKKSWLTPFTYAVFLSPPVALCLTTYIFTTNVTEELEIRVGLFSSRHCWAKLCCILRKTSYAKGSSRMRLFGPAHCSQMLFPTPRAFTSASSRQWICCHQGWTDTSFPHHTCHTNTCGLHCSTFKVSHSIWQGKSGPFCMKTILSTTRINSKDIF